MTKSKVTEREVTQTERTPAEAPRPQDQDPAVLTPLEEKVVRMRRGLTAPGDLTLGRHGEGHPELEAQLLEMEKKVLAAVGPRSNPEKRRIVSALRKKK